MENNNIVKPWFFGVNEYGLNRYTDLIKVAVKSMSKTNLSITKFCIYDGLPNEFTKWLEENGITILYHTLTFKDVIEKNYKDDEQNRLISLGAYLRIDIPYLIEKYSIKCDYYFYSDCDTMFVGDITPLFTAGIKTLAMAPEFDQNNYSYVNSGCMISNTKFMQSTYKSLVKYIEKNIQNFTVYDQSALNGFYPLHERQKLNVRFNWKGYWGHGDNVKIVHFHGPKPNQYPPYLENSTVCPTISHLCGGAFPEYCKQWFEILNS